MQCGTLSFSASRSDPPRFPVLVTAGALFLVFLSAGVVLQAQPQVPAQPATRTQPVHKAVHTRKPSPERPSPAATAATTAPSVAQAAPPEPPKPDWPANDKPVPAKITWDSRGLTIDANNSSLGEILKEVATETGAKLNGSGGDERIFGIYGPGPARDVITQLLDGSPYNVLMVGDQGEGTPREIVLTSKPTGPAPANNNRQNNDEEQGEVEQPQQPMPGIPAVHNAFGPPGQPPEQYQQMMEERRAEMEQREEQQRQAQQQQQPQQDQQQQQNPPQ